MVFTPSKQPPVEVDLFRPRQCRNVKKPCPAPLQRVRSLYPLLPVQRHLGKFAFCNPEGELKVVTGGGIDRLFTELPSVAKPLHGGIVVQELVGCV